MAPTLHLEWLADGDLLSVPGWRGAGIKTGVKESGAPDLALFQADSPRPAAAVFTRNELPAACVLLGRQAMARRPELRTLCVNSGNANAMTGAQGRADAERIAELVERHAGGPALAVSTGIIGVPLPMGLVEPGIEEAARSLTAPCPQLADAILTTDTCRKTCAVEAELPAHGDQPARVVRVGGMAKGSGMIHPNMATMLAFVATDAPVETGALDGLLRRATDASFHEISVDGDTSTNDTVVLLGGPSGAQDITDGDPRLPALEAAVTAVMQRLARAIVLDGEGRTRLMELHVTGARDTASARRVAESVACSSLVKTALAGGDPNWGRILAAAANAGVSLEGAAPSLEVCGHRVFEDGAPTDYDRGEVDTAFSAEEVQVVLHLGLGDAIARRWTTDLSTEYVRLNAEYTT